MLLLPIAAVTAVWGSKRKASALAIGVIGALGCFLASLALAAQAFEYGEVMHGGFGGLFGVDSLGAVFLAFAAFAHLCVALSLAAYFANTPGAMDDGTVAVRRALVAVTASFAATSAMLLSRNLAVIWLCSAISLAVWRRTEGSRGRQAAKGYRRLYDAVATLLPLAGIILMAAAFAGAGLADGPEPTIWAASRSLDIGAMMGFAGEASPQPAKVAYVLMLLGFGMRGGLLPGLIYGGEGFGGRGGDGRPDGSVTASFLGINRFAHLYVMARLTSVMAGTEGGAGFVGPLVLTSGLATALAHITLLLSERGAMDAGHRVCAAYGGIMFASVALTGGGMGFGSFVSLMVGMAMQSSICLASDGRRGPGAVRNAAIIFVPFALAPTAAYVFADVGGAAGLPAVALPCLLLAAALAYRADSLGARPRGPEAARRGRGVGPDGAGGLGHGAEAKPPPGPDGASHRLGPDDTSPRLGPEHIAVAMASAVALTVAYMPEPIAGLIKAGLSLVSGSGP